MNVPLKHQVMYQIVLVQTHQVIMELRVKVKLTSVEKPR